MWGWNSYNSLLRFHGFFWLCFSGVWAICPFSEAFFQIQPFLKCLQFGKGQAAGRCYLFSLSGMTVLISTITLEWVFYSHQVYLLYRKHVWTIGSTNTSAIIELILSVKSPLFGIWKLTKFQNSVDMSMLALL